METKTKWLSWRLWAFSALVWGGLAAANVLFFASIMPVESGRWSLLHGIVSRAWPMVLVTPVLFQVCQALVLRSVPARRIVWMLAGTVLLTFTAHQMILLVWARLLPMSVFVLWGGGGSLAQHSLVVAVSLVILQRRLAETRQRELLAAQLRALRAQLQPHFLFNTLHAISVAGRTDANVATRMLTLLGDLLRQTLRERDGQLISLAEEQQMLQPYLELQQLRFADRLRFVVDFPTEVLGAAVPDLLLQPLVENALQHGIETRPEGGTVHLAARRWSDRLEIQVRDDGAGLDQPARDPEFGIGLGTTTARLRALFGSRAEVKLAARPGGGTIATLILPFRELEAAAQTSTDVPAEVPADVHVA